MKKYETYHLDKDSILEKMKNSKTKIEYLRWQVIYLRQFQELSLPKISQITHTSVRTISNYLL